MMESVYDYQDLVRVAGRWNNPKRNYLLVNPLQAKHIPVKPSAALGMMSTLGRLVRKRMPGCRLVIGFAETATAMGMAVAAAIAPDCMYWHTTREQVNPVRDQILFREEHSHAVAQKLVVDGLGEALAKTDSIVFVDDELTTGRTLRDMIGAMSEKFPEMAGKHMAAACAISRLSGSDREAMRDAGIDVISLVDNLPFDASAKAAQYVIQSPGTLDVNISRKAVPVIDLPSISDPRYGVMYCDYAAGCGIMSARVVRWALDKFHAGTRIRVLGTEECIYPSLMAGVMLELAGFDVYCHSTTRSPIGVCDADGYPIRSSVCIPSPYDLNRTTYLYNLDPMDACVIITDVGYYGDLFSGLAAKLPEPVTVFCVK